jgi:hypothetical protein
LGLRRCSSQISKLHTIEAATYRQCLLYSAKRNRFQVGQTPGFKKLDNKPQPYDGTHKEQCSKTTETTTRETPTSIIAQDNGVAAALRTFQLHTIHYIISALREATDFLFGLFQFLPFITGRLVSIRDSITDKYHLKTQKNQHNPQRLV